MNDIHCDFTGHTAFVTGAGWGIGREISRELGAAGAFVVVSDLHEDTCRLVVDEIEGKAGNGRAVATAQDDTDQRRRVCA